MKKKSIFVVALAALMLIAFTACEQQVPNIPAYGDNEIAKVEIVSAPAFHAGKTGETGTGIVKVTRVGGTVTDNVYATIAINGKTVVGENEVKITLPGDSTTSYLGVVDALSVERIEIASDSYDDATKVSVASQVTLSSAVGYYSDGTTINLLGASGLDYGTKALDRATSSIVVTVPAGDLSADELKGSLKVTLADETPVKISALTAEYDAEEVVVGQAFDPSLVVVTATYGTDDDAYDEVLTRDVDYTLDVAKYTFADADVTSGYKVNVTLIDPSTADTGKTTAVCTIPVVKDYITVFEPSLKEKTETTPAPVFYAGDTISVNSFNFKPTRMKVASSVPEGTSIATNAVSVDAAYAKIPVGATGSFEVHFTLAGTNNSGHAVHATYTVTISEKTTTPEEPDSGTGETEVTK